MSNEKLKAVLGEDGFAELVALQTPPAPTIVPAVQPEWQKVALGLVKSKAVWLGAAIAGLPSLLPIISPDLQQLMTPAMYQKVMLLAGTAVAVVRFYTSQSIKEKGAS